MKRKIAMIRFDLVVNVAVVDDTSDWQPSGYTLVDVTDLNVGVGYRLVDGNFIPPDVVENDPNAL